MKPTMSVVELRQRTQILAGSGYDVKSDVLDGGGSDENYSGDIR